MWSPVQNPVFDSAMHEPGELYLKVSKEIRVCKLPGSTIAASGEEPS